MRCTEEAIDQLLAAWPRLRRRPNRDADVSTVVGTLGFELTPPGMPTIVDAYELRIDIALSKVGSPLVFETGQRISREPGNHVNPDGSLCLGSPMQLQLRLGRSPDLIKFVEECIVPYLYAASWRQQGGDGFPFQELAHAGEGVMDDYGRLLRVNGYQSVEHSLRLLSSRPRVANKRPCPCGCGRRLGRCDYRFQLIALRLRATRSYYRRALSQFRFIASEFKPVRPPARPKVKSL